MARGLSPGRGGGGGQWRGEPTLELVFAYVDGGWRVDYVGGEVVYHDDPLGVWFGDQGGGKGDVVSFRRGLGKEVGWLRVGLEGKVRIGWCS